MQAKRPVFSLSFFAIGVLICLISTALTVFVMQSLNHKQNDVVAISKEGVIFEIQKLGRLQSAAFGVDTIVTASKEGTWQKLWQDEQKGLFIARGRVLAGVDLNKLTSQMVQIQPQTLNSSPTKTDKNDTIVSITLPAVEIFSVYLDDVQLYDWQTGLFGMMSNDPKILEQAQDSAKTEVLKKACQGEILSIATDSAKEQIEHLFALSGIKTIVTIEKSNACT